MAIFKKIGNWFKNYWYYYKWTAIVIAFFVGVIIFCSVQSGTKEQYDVSILYTGPHFFEVGEKEGLASSFSQIMSSDLDGDGKKAVQIIDMPAFTDAQIKAEIGDSNDPVLAVKYAPYAIDNVKESFSQHIFTGETSICILDPYWYDIVKKADGLVRLEDVLGYKPDGMADPYSVKLTDTEFGKFFGSAEKLPDDAVICFRRLPTASAITGVKEAEKRYEYSKKLLIDIFAFESPE